MFPVSWWATFLTAMTPIGELRAAIPLGIGVYHLSPVWVFVVAVLGNLIPVILIYFLLGPLTNWLRRVNPMLDNFFAWLFKKTYHRHAANVDKYGSLALALFVAIPLPITGGWTGALIAYVFGIKWQYAMPSLILGVITAGVIVTILTNLGLWAFSL